MKKLTLFTLTMVMFTILSAQEVAVLNNASGEPAYITLHFPDTTYVYHFKGEIPEHITFGGKYCITPKEHFQRDPSSLEHKTNLQMDTINNGLPPEADLPYMVRYSPDGTKIIVIYRHSNNVVVYNADNLTVLADIRVGISPEGLYVNNEHIYVACYNSNDIYIINLTNYTIENHFEVQEHPCLVEVNQDETIIYVGFSMGGHSKNGCLEAYDLDSYEKLWENNWPRIDEVGVLTGSIGRRVYTISDFLLIADDQYIAAQKKPGLNTVILDAITGDVVTTFERSQENVANLKASVTKDTLFIQTHSSDSLGFYKMNAFTHEIIDSVKVANPVPMLVFYAWQKNLGVNYSGSKMFLEILNMQFDGISVLVNFDTHNAEIIEHGNSSLSQVNVIQSYDRRYVISMQNDYRIFDFEEENFVYFNSNVSLYNNYKLLAPSPISYEFVWCDFTANYTITSIKKDETITIFNYDDPTNLTAESTILCGTLPEADLTHDVVWDDGNDLIFTTNPLSGTLCIVDAITYENDTIIDMPGISSIEQVTDELLLLGGRDYPYLHLFDIPSRKIIKTFNLSNAHILLPSPDQQYAYAFSRKQSKLVKIYLDGENSSIIDELYILDNYGYYVTWEYSYQPGITPDGKYIVMGQQNTAVIIDTETMEVVCNVPISGDYVFDLAFSHDSKRVCLVHGFLDSRYDIVYIDGADSYLEHAIYSTNDEGSMAVTYSIEDKSFYIAKEYDIWVFDPVSGVVSDTLQLYPYDNQLDIAVDPQGIPIVLSYRHLYYGENKYNLDEPTRELNMDHEHQRCLIPCPGPDRVYVLDFLTTKLHEINTKSDEHHVQIFPNPVNHCFTINTDSDNFEVFVYDNKGNLLIKSSTSGRSKTINLDLMPVGLYLIQIKGDGWKKSEKVVKK